MTEAIKKAIEKADTLSALEQTSVEEKVPVKETASEFIHRIQTGGITDEDIPETVRQDWIRSVFGMTPFSYTMDIFGGKAKVTFCEPPVDYRNAYRTLSLRFTTDNYQALTAMSILLYLKEISGEFNMTFEPSMFFVAVHPDAPDLEDVITRQYDKLCEKLPSAIARMLPTLWMLYSNIVGWLTEQAMPASF